MAKNLVVVFVLNVGILTPTGVISIIGSVESTATAFAKVAIKKYANVLANIAESSHVIRVVYIFARGAGRIHAYVFVVEIACDSVIAVYALVLFANYHITNVCKHLPVMYWVGISLTWLM